jgi:hypothetical protein
MTTEVMQPPQLSTGRLLLLGASSVILCISFIMAVFAPFPLSLAIILYGRTKGYLLGLAGLAVTFVFATALYGDLTLTGFYFCVFLFAIGISEVVLRGIAPVKGMIGFGLGFILIASTGFAVLMSKLQVTPKQFIIQQLEKSADQIAKQKEAVELSGDKDSIQVLQLLDRPDLLAKELIESFPSYFFMGVFLMLWFNMFLVLKSRRLLLSGQDYPHDEKSLLNFKVPFEFVIVLVLGLALAVFGEQIGPGPYELIGYNVVRCLGIFYFFQGFGVFSDMLNFLGIVGFFRTLIVMITIFMANYLIAVAGLFDNWFDFRKYFVKRKTEE